VIVLGLNRVRGPNFKSFSTGLMLSILLYYWGMSYAHNPKHGIGNLQYYFYIVPSALFVCVGSTFFFLKSKTRPETLMFVGISIIVNVVAVSRGDISTILSVSLLLFTFAIFSHLRFYFDADILNYIFLLSVILSVFSYHLGLSDFGYVPGLSYTSSSQGLSWRVSLFPGLPESAFFSAIIFLINLIYPHLVFRRIVVPFSMYFLVFGGLRSAVLATIIAVIYLLLSSWKVTKNRLLLVIAYFSLLCIFLILMLVPNIFMIMSDLGIPFLDSYLFRSIGGGVDPDDLNVTMYRGWLWLQHIKIWLGNWVVGVGTFDFTELVSESIILGHQGTGSESFFTGFLARIGVFSIGFLTVLFSITIRSIWNHEKHIAPISIIFFVAMFTYGSFIVPYNFIFLLMLLLIFGQLKVDCLEGARN
jgi:hypothetical protein